MPDFQRPEARTCRVALVADLGDGGTRGLQEGEELVARFGRLRSNAAPKCTMEIASATDARLSSFERIIAHVASFPVIVVVASASIAQETLLLARPVGSAVVAIRGHLDHDVTSAQPAALGALTWAHRLMVDVECRPSVASDPKCTLGLGPLTDSEIVAVTAVIADAIRRVRSGGNASLRMF
jgi:hypothetical protein